MKPSLASFANELCKVANPQAIQGMIDKKLAPLKPPTPAPMQGPMATPPPPMAAPRTMDQRIQDTGAQMKATIQAAGPSTPQIKTPRTVMGVRG